MTLKLIAMATAQDSSLKEKKQPSHPIGLEY